MSLLRHPAGAYYTIRLDRNGRLRTFDYDALNRLTAESWWDGSNVVYTAVMGYDLAGQLVSGKKHNQ